MLTGKSFLYRGWKMSDKERVTHWRRSDPERYNEYMREYRRRRKAKDPLFNMALGRRQNFTGEAWQKTKAAMEKKEKDGCDVRHAES
jgi:hypothetical protein